MTDIEAKLIGILEDRLKEFHSLLSQNARFSAATRLGQVAAVLHKLPVSQRDRWDRILDEKVRLLGLDSDILDGIEKNVDRIKRIGQHGGRYLFEELCLVLSVRLDVACALTYLRRINNSLDDRALSQIDSYLLEMAKDSETRVAMTRAAMQISRNFGLPITIEDILPQMWLH